MDKIIFFTFLVAQFVFGNNASSQVINDIKEKNKAVKQEISMDSKLLTNNNSVNNHVNLIYTETAATILDIKFINENVGWMVESNRILKTTDGGINWTLAFTYSSLEDWYQDLFFIDENIGFLVTRYEVSKTVDGGSTWVSKYYDPAIFSGSVFSLQKIDFNGTNGLVGTQDCAIGQTCPRTFLKTIDNGETWVKVGASGLGFVNFKFLNSSEVLGFTVPTFSLGVYTGLKNEVLKSSDGGATWSSYISGANYFSEASIINYNQFFSSYKSVRIDNQNQAIVINHEELNFPSPFQIINPSFYNDKIGFALGSTEKSNTGAIDGFHRHIWRTNDGGLKWYIIDEVEIQNYQRQNYKLFTSINNTHWMVSDDNRVYKFTYQKTSKPSLDVVNAGSITYPSGLFVDDNQGLYVTDYWNDRIQKVDLSNNAISTVASGLSSPTAILKKGMDLYITNFFNGRITKWTEGASSGTTLAGEPILMPNGSTYERTLYRPTDTQVDDNGNLYIADSWNHRVVKWAPGDTRGTLIAGGTGTSGGNILNYPGGIFLKPDGTLYVADTYNHRVLRYSPNQTQVTVVAGGNGIGSKLNKLNKPAGIFVDENDDIYIADYGNNRIQKWTQNNAVNTGQTVVGDFYAGSDFNQLNQPQDIFIKNQVLYVADRENNRILKVGLPCSINSPIVQNDTILKTQSVTLLASGCTGSTKWFNNATEIDPIFTGTTYQAPMFSESMYFYVSCSNGQCETSKVPVYVHIKDCYPSFDFGNTIQASGIYKADQFINSSSIIETSIDYLSENQITLKPGFVTNVTAVFKAEIRKCE